MYVRFMHSHPIVWIIGTDFFLLFFCVCIGLCPYKTPFIQHKTSYDVVALRYVSILVLDHDFIILKTGKFLEMTLLILIWMDRQNYNETGCKNTRNSTNWELSSFAPW
jgi:hypothetical protein